MKRAVDPRQTWASKSGIYVRDWRCCLMHPPAVNVEQDRSRGNFHTHIFVMIELLGPFRCLVFRPTATSELPNNTLPGRCPPFSVQNMPSPAR